jgi:nucleoside-diphosphate kinase
LLKPDGTKRQLLTELLIRIRVRKLRIAAIKTVELTPSCVDLLYGRYIDEPFYVPNRDFMLSGPCVAIHVTGKSAVSKVREIIGTGSFPYKGRSFRATYATTQRRNVVHASDSPTTAAKELSWFFTE